MASAFRKEFRDQADERLLYRKQDGRYQLNLWRANEIIFSEAGVAKENIYTTDICTHCNPQLLFSHRTVGTERGNLAAFLCLKEP